MGVLYVPHVLFATANIWFSRLVCNVCTFQEQRALLQTELHKIVSKHKPNDFNVLYLIKFSQSHD